MGSRVAITQTRTSGALCVLPSLNLGVRILQGEEEYDISDIQTIFLKDGNTPHLISDKILLLGSNYKRHNSLSCC